MRLLCLSLAAMAVLPAGVLLAQGVPPWKTTGHPLYGNPIGYARGLHRRYVANQAEIARLNATLPTLRRERTGAELSGVGFYDALSDLRELARRKEAIRKEIEERMRVRSELESEWARWCELGLLGSPMPPLSAANESIADTYLDNSTNPGVRKTRLTDRIDFNIRYFLEQRTAPPPPAAGGPASGTFTKDPFNGLQITYAISGAALGKFDDGGPFEGWIRSYEGSLQGGTLGVSGTVTKGPGSSKEYPGHARITVWAGDQKAEKAILLIEGKSDSYNVSVNVPEGAAAGGVTVNVQGDYRNGEVRFVQVTAKLTNPNAIPAAKPGTKPKLPEPQPASRSGDLGAGFVYPGSRPIEVALSGRPETERSQIASSQPMSWVAGDRITTGAGGTAAFAFPESIRGVIGANSKLELRKNGAFLGAGSVLWDLLKPGWGFTLQTPSAAIQAADGLLAARVLQDASTLVGVGIGSARIANAAGNNPVTVQAGNWVRVAAGREPSAPAPLTQQHIQELFGQIDVMSPPLQLEPERMAAPAPTPSVVESRPPNPQPRDIRPSGIPAIGGGDVSTVAGTWESDFGPVALQVRGSSIEGSWTDKAGGRGQILNGQLAGTSLSFEYVWPGGRRGRASFAWNPDARRWEGNWRHIDGTMGFWNLGPAKTAR